MAENTLSTKVGNYGIEIRAEQLSSGKFHVIPGRSADIKQKCLREFKNHYYPNWRIREF